jgi:hypothetical protein
MQGRDHENEGDDRSEDHDVRKERPDGCAAVPKSPEQIRILREDVAREAPPGLRERPEDGCESETPREQREDVAAALEAALGHDDVERIGAGRAERSRDADSIQRPAAPELDDEREPGEREGATQSRRRTGSCTKNRAQRATSTGAMYWITSAIPMSMCVIAVK